MKLKLQLIIESDSGETEMVQEVAKLERYALRPETLGLTLSEANPSFSTRGGSDPGRGSKWTSCLKGLHYKSDLSVLV
jgi:hypothetical protein